MRTLELNCPVCGESVIFNIDAAGVRVSEKYGYGGYGGVAALSAIVEMNAIHSCP